MTRDYDNRNRRAMAEQRQLSKQAEMLLKQIEQQEDIHPATLDRCMQLFDKVEEHLRKVEDLLLKIGEVRHETARVRNQRISRKDVHKEP